MKHPITHAIKNLNISTSTSSLRVGTYDSVLVDVQPNEKFIDGAAYTFKYELTDPQTGEKFEKSETIINDARNKRFNTILKNLKNKGIIVTNFEDFVGMKERVTLKYEPVGGRSYLNIVDREFIEFQQI